MPTTGGALVFDGFVPPYEATLTRNLRDAGAIIIAKTGMTELANWVAGRRMPGNYNALKRLRHATRTIRGAIRATRPSTAGRRWRPADRAPASAPTRELLGGQRRHRDVGIDPEPGESEHAGGGEADGRPRQPATASFRSPPIRTRRARWPSSSSTRRSCSACSRVPRPIRTIRPRATCARPPGRDYTRFLKRRWPARARASASRAPSSTTAWRPAGTDRPRGGLNPEQTQVMADAIAVLKQQGAIVVDPADIPSVVDQGRRRTTSSSGVPARARTTPRARTRTVRSCSSTA